MTTFTPAYRITVYEPRSEQSNAITEPDVLSPIAGAAHSDPFQYATVQGLSGFQPFLHKISGRKGRYDPLTRRTDIGTYTVQVLDRKTATANAIRHATAYLGDTRGRNRLIGCKVFVEESLDGGVTWAAYFTGRITSVRLDGPVVLEFAVRSMLAELNIPVFVGRPAASLTYVSPSQYAPLGLSANYGPLTAAPGIPMTFATTGAVFSLANLGQATAATAVTDALRAVIPMAPYYGQTGLDAFVASEPTDIRLRCTFTSGTFNGTTKEYRIRGAYYYPAGSRLTVRTAGSNDVLFGVSVALLTSTLDPGYAVLPANGDTAIVRIVAADAPPTEATPIRIADRHPVRLFRDLLEGGFSYLNADGTVRQRVRTDTGDAGSTFDALEADLTFGTFRAPIVGAARLNSWAENNLCRIYGFCYRDSPTGKIEVVDVRTPSSLAGVPTITDDDCVVGPLTWEQTRDDGITVLSVTTALERLFSVDATVDAGNLKTPNDLIANTPRTLRERFGFREDMSENPLDLDALGLRWFESESQQGRVRGEYIRAQVARLIDEFRGPYGSAPMRVRVQARRTATVAALKVAGLVIATFSQLPDPATNQRGGSRLFRVTEVSENGPSVDLELLDMGPSSVMVAPTVGALGAGTDPSGQITVPVTLNASSDPVRIEVAVTRPAVTALGSVPAEAWQVAQVVTASGTVTVGGLPSLSRIWVRLRSQPTAATTARLPSTYVSPTTAFLDTTGPGTPGTLSFSNISTQGATVTWSNTATSSRIAVDIAAANPFDPSEPLGNTGQRVATLPPGSTSVDVAVAIQGAVNWVYVYYLDERGGRGATRAGSYTPTGTAPTATAPTSLVIL